LLYAALSHAAPASAADDMNAGQTDRKVIQMGKGEQDKMKGDDMRAGQTDRKGGQSGMKGEEDKTRRVDNTGKPIDKEKEIKQNELGEIKK
jgi:hypothetical protein